MNKNIRDLFSAIPRTYELINHILTLGLDSYWRKSASKLAVKEGGKLWLDVCCGTAQTAANLRCLADKETRIVALDFCLPMLKEAREKIIAGSIFLCAADAGNLPFSDGTFDLVTISFATRNINTNRKTLIKYFREFRRVLKPEGRFVNLETSQPESVLLRMLFRLYVGFIVGPAGFLVSGSKTAYQYLSYTIPRFFNAGELSEVLYQSGFRKVALSRLSFGITAIHIAKN